MTSIVGMRELDSLRFLGKITLIFVINVKVYVYWTVHHCDS